METGLFTNPSEAFSLLYLPLSLLLYWYEKPQLSSQIQSQNLVRDLFRAEVWYERFANPIFDIGRKSPSAEVPVSSASVTPSGWFNLLVSNIRK